MRKDSDHWYEKRRAPIERGQYRNNHRNYAGNRVLDYPLPWLVRLPVAPDEVDESFEGVLGHGRLGGDGGIIEMSVWVVSSSYTRIKTKIMC